MHAITRFFLRAKHWQIFLLLFVVGFVGQGLVLGSTLTTARPEEIFGRTSLLLGLSTAVLMFCFLGWYWSMGSFLSSIVQPELKMKMGFFRFAVVYPGAYVFFFIAAFHSNNPLLLVALLPLHFFAMFCIFYDSYFVSKSLVVAETNKPVSFYEYSGPFFLLWFFPLGVWFIQPRINRLFEQPPPQLPFEPRPMLEPGRAVREIPAEAPRVYAGFWLRLAATVIDSLAIFFPVIVLAFVVIFASRLLGALKGYDSAIVTAVALPATIFLACCFYFAGTESSAWQATLGKMAVGVYVCGTDGHRLTWGHAMARNLAKLLSNMTAGIGFFLCGFTEKKQALHDIITRCLVLRRPER